MARIFLSYRRQDSAGVAGRIYDRLCQHFGKDAVFMDIDTIPFGEDFRKQIDSAVGQCAVVLAVVGTKWAGRTKAGRRIDDPRDFIRIELESALQRNLPVIPILVDRARMLAEADLPPSLAWFAYRNAVELDQGRDFHSHVDRLIRGIEFQLQKSSGVVTEPSESPLTQIAAPASAFPATTLINSVGMTLVRIEAGDFLMGTTDEQVDHLIGLFPDSNRTLFSDEQPQHHVAISQPFVLGIHPVTQGQYRALTGKSPSQFTGSDDLPVERVSWVDAVEFCNKLSEREKQASFYEVSGMQVTVVGGSGYRMPSEAEWEYACRAKRRNLMAVW